MASSTTEVPIDTNPKPQKQTTPDSQFNSLSSSPTKISSKPTNFSASASDSKSLTSPSSSNKSEFGYPSFSQLLEGVMAAKSDVSSHPLAKSAGFQGQFEMSHQEALATVTAKAAQAQAQMHLQTVSTKSSSADTQEHTLKHKKHLQKKNDKDSSTPASQPANSSGQKSPGKQPDKTASPTSLASLPSPKERDDKQEGNTEELCDDSLRTPQPDGYSWRKYGQKQVKSSGSSRSYYRCTYCNCSAKKKVQHLDGSGRIIEVVYKGNHNHDPPQNFKGLSRKKGGPPSSIVTHLPLIDSSENSVAQKHDVLHPPTCRKDLDQAIPLTLECRDGNLNSSASMSPRVTEEQHAKTPDSTPRHESELTIQPAEVELGSSNNDNEHAMTDPMKQQDLAPFKKRRLKEKGKAQSESVYRTFKEPKIVVQSAADVGTSNDGYRWRKYGQKMVKGNPHPRSYYRCSSAGCPVRKHVERATDNSMSFIVTYEGNHDHDLPVPKKPHNSLNSSAFVSATDTTNNKLLTKSIAKSPLPSEGRSKQESGDGDSESGGEKAVVDPGADKVLESARTLLSIGIELKSC